MRYPISLAAWVFIVHAAAAQSNAALMANDHYTRSHDYDLLHQRIVLSDFNWDSTSFDGTVTTTLVARRPGLDSVILDEGALLANSKVTDRAGAALRTARHGDTLVVFPSRAVPFDDTLTFTISYHGKIHSGDGLTFITNDGLKHRPDQIWSMGEDHSNHYWFPTYDFPNDKMTWEMVATVPAADLAVSNGRLVSNVTNGSTRTMTWRQESPASTYLVSLIVAPLAEIHDSWQGVPLVYYTYHEDSTRAWPLFHETADMIDSYSRLTGVRYPWAKYSQTTVADFFGGMENVSATTLVDWLPDARAYVDRPWYHYILIPHELAHQWFGDYVTLSNWANMWLNEGFAEFMPGQYWGGKLGPHGEQDYYVDEYAKYLQTDARRIMPLASLGSNNIYPKGALVLEMLKRYLGPDRFWAAVHLYLTEHAFANATSDDLRQAVLVATGENLDWFWNQWIYSAGLPALTVTAAYDSAAATVTVHVTQTQVDTIKPDSTGRQFTVPLVFRMPVAIRVATRAGDITQHAMLNAREQTIVVSGVKSDPTMVIFDDGNTILKQLDFDEPTFWLANQLRGDPDLWDRQWAIGQLAHRTGDPAAAEALTNAALHADYFLTRQEAVEALAAFRQSGVVPALLGALHDTSAAVRTAAAHAAGEIGNDAFTAPLREAFQHDSSYEVRAAALIPLVRADSAHAHQIIVTALGTPSYQEVVQHAGLTAAAQFDDTASTGQIEALLDLDDWAAEVLGVFVLRGNTHSLDLIVKHLDDPRAGVRRWVVDAIREIIVPPSRDPRMAPARDAAIARLKAAAPALTHADTREEITDLLKN